MLASSFVPRRVTDQGDVRGSFSSGDVIVRQGSFFVPGDPAAAAIVLSPDAADRNVIQPTGDFPGLTILGPDGGDNVGYYVSGAGTDGQFLRGYFGTAADPVEGLGPAVKISKTEHTLLSQGFENGATNERNAALHVASTNYPFTDSQVQVCAVMATAISCSTDPNPFPADSDACAGLFLGRNDGAQGIGIGLTAGGRTTASGGLCLGIEVDTHNYSGAPLTTFSKTGYPAAAGAWFGGHGNDCTVAVAIADPFSIRYQEGIAFFAWHGGPIINASIRDEGASNYGMLINGVKATAAIAVAAGCGPIITGGTTPWYSTVEIQGFGTPNVDAVPVASFGCGTGTGNYAAEVRNGAGVVRLGVNSAGNAFLHHITSGKTLSLGNGGAVAVGDDSVLTVGFLGATPVAKQGATIDLRQALINYGLYTSGGATPLDLNGGLLTADAATISTGPVLVGHTTAWYGSTGLEVFGTADVSATPLVAVGCGTGAGMYGVQLRNGVGASTISITTTGNGSWQPSTSGKSVSLRDGSGARQFEVMYDGTWALSGKTPVALSAAYTPTNVTTDRSYDANATSLDELGDVVGTLIADLQAKGVIG